MAGSFDAAGLSRLEITALVKDLAKADMVMRRQLPKRLREAAKPVADAAKVNAAAVSSSIKIGTRSRLAGRNGAKVSVIGYSPTSTDERRSKKNRTQSPSPLAGLMERGSTRNNGTIRHPIFGTDRWVDPPQRTQPYLQPALDAHREEAIAKTTEVITDVMIALKFH